MKHEARIFLGYAIPENDCTHDQRLPLLPSQKTWLVLFGMDSKSGAYPISDKAYQAHLYEGAKPISFSVKLDKNVGTEAFIALTSTNSFQLTEDLLRTAHKELYAEGSKGIIADQFAFKFGDKIDSWPFYCQHTD